MKRVQFDLIRQDLEQKMVFLSGPRQVGKTWLSKELGRTYNNTVYLSYDSPQDREVIGHMSWMPETDLLILDELHKMEEWKNYLKGLYDTRPTTMRILVTGSARLETFRQSGDSLAGRYFRHRLNPFSAAELQGSKEETLTALMIRGGFPEPFLAESDRQADRWRLQYTDGLVREDILDFEKIHDFRAIQLTLELLRNRVGSPVSHASLARDVNCSPNTIKRYIEVLESLYIVFRVTPFHKNIARSILKEPKIYFYDTGMVKGDQGVVFENMVAVSLLKHLNAIEDYDGKRTALHYLRTKEKKEVDFALAVEDQPLQLIEVKWADQALSPTLSYFHKKYDLPAIQLVHHLRHEQRIGEIEIRRALDFLTQLRL